MGPHGTCTARALVLIGPALDVVMPAGPEHGARTHIEGGDDVAHRGPRR